MKRIYLIAALCLSCIVASAKFPIDFSRVGYMWGERQIPDYPVCVTLSAPADGSDMTAAIQSALDNAGPSGAVLLKEGIYNVSGA